MPVVDFFYDLVSPYSYLAATQMAPIEALAQVQWRPFWLAGVMKASANTPPFMVPAKAQYMSQDLRRMAAYYGVKLQMPQRFPLDTLSAMRCLHALAAPVRATTSLALFEALWVEGRDISEVEVLKDLLGAELVERAASAEIKLALKETTDEAVMRGAFGAPSLFLDDELFFGCDRLALLEHRLSHRGGGQV